MNIQHVDDLLALDDDLLVQASYQLMFGRNPDDEGRRHYLGLLKSGMGKPDLVAQLATSKEAKSRSISLPGLQKLIAQHKKQRHWLWGWWYRQQNAMRAINRIERALIQIQREIRDGKVERSAEWHADPLSRSAAPLASAAADLSPHASRWRRLINNDLSDRRN